MTSLSVLNVYIYSILSSSLFLFSTSVTIIRCDARVLRRAPLCYYNSAHARKYDNSFPVPDVSLSYCNVYDILLSHLFGETR